MSLRTIVQASPALLVRTHNCQTWRAFSTAVPSRVTPSEVMSTSKTTSVPHEERTAAEPREHGMHKVILDRIKEVNTNIRLLRLKMHHGDEQLQACNLNDHMKFVLTSNLCSVVPAGAMARCICSWYSAGWRLYDYLYTQRSYTRQLPGAGRSKFSW